MEQTRLESAIAAFNSGALAEAQELCVAILAHAPDEPFALLILARIRAQMNDAAGSLQLLYRAASVPSRDHSFLFNLGSAFNAIGYPEEARRAFEAALAIHADFPMALAGLGNVLLQAGDTAGARRSFERALAIKPQFPQALAALADLALREHAREEAEALARQALALSPDGGPALLVLAQIEAAREEYEDALTLVGRVLAKGGLNGAQTGLALGLRGQILEGLARYDDAFQSFAEANEIQRKTFAVQFDREDLAASPAMIRKLTKFVEGADPSAWPKPEDDGRPPPVFLVGFPRSGTTLMGQIFGAHPDAVTLEEGERFADATAALILTPGALERWTAATPAEIARLRNAYWLRAGPSAAQNPRRILVDKMPMNLALLPVIHLLFPDAKIILAVRDPRDVVLSCFQQRFQMNAATFRFLSLETAAAYYDTVMRLGAAARERLPLDVHELRYEDLVRDFDTAVARALTFLGLPWDDAVKSYASAAKKSAIRTPSAPKVVLPIYASAAQRWRNYARQMLPCAPLLEPWVARLGYEPSEPDR